MAKRTVLLQNRPNPKSVWFFVCPGVELLDLVGPWEVLAHANDILGSQRYVSTLVAPEGGMVASRHGLILGGATSLASLRRHPRPHTAIVTGGSPLEQDPAAEREIVEWLGRHRDLPRIVSICTGAFLLGAAGLLDRRRATTHWMFLEEFRRRFPKAQVQDDAIYLNDGRIWTSAGITAGVDLALALVEEDHGHEVAMAVAQRLLLFLRRSGKQAQFSPVLRKQGQEPPRLRDLRAFVSGCLDESLSIERLAQEVGMSRRSFSRWFRREAGETPAAFVQRIRLEEAQRLLTETDFGLEEVASRTGLGDPATLWRTFTRKLGVSPGDYRRRFLALS